MALPILLSTTYPHYSWGPGRFAWNVTGLGPLLIGFSLVASAVRENITRIGGWRKLGTTQKYLIPTGPYRYSRNPMYLAAALIWLGWTMLFGSWFLLGGLLVMVGGISIIGIPVEEKQWEASLGNAYLQYKKDVARWLGRRKIG